MTGPAAPRASALLAAALLASGLLAGCSVSLPTLAGSPEDPGRGRLPVPPAGGYPDLDRPYPLLPGDRIEIRVQEDPDLTIPVEIPPDGVIEVYKSEKDGGPRQTVQARGLTASELKEKIADVYQQVRFPSRPYVQVTLLSSVPRTVYLRGAVKSETGTVELPKTGRLTLWRAIQAGGGITEDADLTRVRISRRDPASGAEVSLPPFDLEEMSASAAYDRDPPLEPNDIITVPKLGKVTIWGNVNAPGSYLCRRGMTLTDLIGEAEGLKPFSKLRDVRVIRGVEGTGREKTFRVDLQAVLDGQAADPVLAPADRVWIDEDWK